MSIEKKSLISTLKTTKKANVASSPVKEGTSAQRLGAPPTTGKRLGAPPTAGKRLGAPPTTGKRLGAPPTTGKRLATFRNS